MTKYEQACTAFFAALICQMTGAQARAMIAAANRPDALEHSIRFRKVSNNYALQVTRAYNGDQAAAARDDDATVAERVRQYEIAGGRKPRDWVKIGQVDEGREDD